jgi:threonine synthase
MGLPVAGFVAATNANDVVPEYLRGGIYSPRLSMATISNAMDVGAPSNFARMSDLFEGSWEKMRSRISGMAVTDAQTRAAIREVWERFSYQIDPHGAVAWLAAREWRSRTPGVPTIVLETAHPSKFPEVMNAELGAGVVLVPERLAVLENVQKVAESMAADPVAFREWLISNG